MGRPTLDLVACADDDTFLCGTLPVPLNRRHPDGRMVNLHVEVFPHTDGSASAQGAVLVTEGGPGYAVSTTGQRYSYAFYLLAEVAQTRDLVFVDQRGVGQSEAIDCAASQQGGPFYESAAQCHDQLGDTANMYSTTDVADDLDDVRAALGYQKVDLLGGSYAGLDMITYTVRHKAHVRSVSLGSPVVLEGVDPFGPETAEAIPVMVDAICGRSPACAAANRNPAQNLAWLAKRLRAHPLRGTGIDAGGAAHELVVTESDIATLIPWYSIGFQGLGTVAQAAAALRAGDDLPLLRLVANATPANYDGGDPAQFSNGHNLARSCVEGPLAWDRGASAPARQAQYQKALAKQPATFGPFSKEAWAVPGYAGWLPQPCIASRWEYRPVYPAGTKVTGIPALVIGSDYDLNVPESIAKLAKKTLVGARYVAMQAAGHVPWWWSDCGPRMISQFIANLDPGDTSCAAQPVSGWWEPGSFPTSMASVPPATQTSGPAATDALRRLATTVAWTVFDGFQQTIAVSAAGDETPDSVGLRAGTVHVAFDPNDGTPTLTFDSARFTSDVAVSGSFVWTGAIDAGDFMASVPGAGTQAVALSGPWNNPGGSLTVTLDVGGQPATFAVPSY